MQNLSKIALNTLKSQSQQNYFLRKLMKFQKQQFGLNYHFNFPLKGNLCYLSSFRFSSQNRCKSNPDKTCQNNGACHSKQESCHDHETCQNQQTQPNHQNQEDPDITRLKELLNSFSKDNQQNHHHEHGCCGGQKECGSNKMKGQDHEHEHENGCCGGHHHHHHHHDHGMANSNQNQDNSVSGNHNHEHGVDHHHHHHDGCCGHDHHHDHDHHHNHGNDAIDIEQLSKQKVETKEYQLNSGDKVEAVLTGDNTISYSKISQIKGVKAREFEHGQLLMIFTCGVCETRSARSFTKKAYNEGVVLIRCEKCDSLHLVADNLGWFDDKKQNIETIMEKKGENIQKVDDSEAINDIISKFVNKEDLIDQKTQNS
ncbi:DNL zinc finger protein (macronuclear) [Tetrahymena thermophila SB210]|uniref:DNL zinc finger protein n=1 Tax=Tetrahymena thermophila (strain SB210) TaxID=312017 RepID=I7M9J3_TETTS|nr:DNL zinc finger protein [Tetrahymena thermophila SB210]EAS01948.3 DNL zinc finger protein [Tetrahymena thermophila SB210]|eukprot:XP_001022193.3 DNL zinc finger protein [Tetrahymena thermophila SB210]